MRRARVLAGLDRGHLAIGLAALVGLVWRVAYTAVLFGRDHFLPDEGDAWLYSLTAHNAARGHWFEHPLLGVHFADHPPLTVAALVPTGWLFPESVMAQRYTFCILGAVAIVLIGLLARSLAGPVAGVVAAGVAAANPNLWMNDAVVMSESPSTVLLVAVLWAAVGLRRSPTLLRAVLVGVLCGVTILARAELGLLVPVLVLPALLFPSAGVPVRWRDRLVRSAAVVATTIVVIAPWTLWNLSELEEPVLVSTNDGTTLLGANCPLTYGTDALGSWSFRCVEDFNRAEWVDQLGLDASQASSLQRRAAFDYVGAHADRLPAVLWARLGRTFGWYGIELGGEMDRGEGRPPWASLAGYATFWVLVPVSIVGVVALRRRRADLRPAVAALVVVVVVSVVFYGISRFRLPLDVMTCVLAGAAATTTAVTRR